MVIRKVKRGSFGPEEPLEKEKKKKKLQKLAKEKKKKVNTNITIFRDKHNNY